MYLVALRTDGKIWEIKEGARLLDVVWIFQVYSDLT